MTIRFAAALPVAAVALVAAGCGGGSSASSGSTVVSATVAVTTTPPATATTSATTTTSAAAGTGAACSNLRQASQQAALRIGHSVQALAGVRTAAQLQLRTKGLEKQIAAASARVQTVATPPGPLTRDKQQIVSSLHALTKQVAAVRYAASSGNLGSAVLRLANVSSFNRLRQASQDVANRCSS